MLLQKCNFVPNNTKRNVAKKLFTPGNKAAAGRGPNKITRTVKETVLAVFTDLQLDNKNNLKAFAVKYPRDFYAIAAKLIPTEVQAKVEAQITWNEIKTYEAEQEANPGA